MTTEKLQRIGTFIIIIGLVLGACLVCMLFQGYRVSRKHDQQFTNSQQIYNQALQYKHQSKCFADSSINYPGSSPKVQHWILMAIKSDSLKKVFADSAYKELIK